MVCLYRLFFVLCSQSPLLRRLLRRWFLLLETLKAAMLKNDSVGSSVCDCVSVFLPEHRTGPASSGKGKGRLPLLYPERGDEAES